jgi:hypothetical protein
MTDSLSNIVAQEETFTRGNSMKMVLKEPLAEGGSNLKLMWLPAHVGIKENETAEGGQYTYKVVKSDWSKWVKRKSWQGRTNGNPQEISW